MANVYANLPAVAANGAGAAVDTSTMGAVKTIVTSDLGGATLNIEFSNEAVPTQYAPACTFYAAGEQTISIAARWMRTRISNYQGAGAPDVELGSTDDGATFANLPVTAGNGTGADTDVSALGLYKTIQVGGPFRGTVVIELSEDGTTFVEGPLFFAPGAITQVLAAEFMRVRRKNVPVVTPGTPIVNVGATELGGGGGGGGGGNMQAFSYAITGLEPDPSELVIPLPAARASTDYFVAWSCAGVANILGGDIDLASRTINQFVLSLSADAGGSDVFMFIVVDAAP